MYSPNTPAVNTIMGEVNKTFSSLEEWKRNMTIWLDEIMPEIDNLFETSNLTLNMVQVCS